MKLNSILEAVADIRRGRMVIVIDDEDRENEGDLVMAADLATPEAINFMAREGRGLICLSLTVAGLDADGFAVALVPHTLGATTLGEAAAGDEVNLETDVLAKYVERLAGLRSDDGDGS